MKTKKVPCAGLALALFSTLNIQLSTAFAQGSLAPPGAPAPTMKSFDQIEARTPISSAPFTITQPGSYYLTANLTVSGGNAININTNCVTLDLNGFSIFSTAASANSTAILLSGNGNLRNIAIANGFIQGGVTNNGSGVYSGSGFAYGIALGGSSAGVDNALVSRVSVSGCLYYGIYLNTNDSTVVESCTVRTVGNTGIYASTVNQSSAIDCGFTAIYGDQVSDCRGQSTGGGYGIYATIALNCYGYSANDLGIQANTALNCYGSTGGGLGVVAYSALNCYGSGSSGLAFDAIGSAIGCYASSISGTGMNAYIANSCYSSSGDGGISYKYNMP